MGTNVIDIQICERIEESPDYKTGARGGEGFHGASLDKAVIIRNGTKSGNDTVDLQFTDANGKKHVAMITAALLATITDLCRVR